MKPSRFDVRTGANAHILGVSNYEISNVPKALMSSEFNPMGKKYNSDNDSTKSDDDKLGGLGEGGNDLSHVSNFPV